MRLSSSSSWCPALAALCIAGPVVLACVDAPQGHKGDAGQPDVAEGEGEGVLVGEGEGEGEGEGALVAEGEGEGVPVVGEGEGEGEGEGALVAEGEGEGEGETCALPTALDVVARLRAGTATMHSLARDVGVPVRTCNGFLFVSERVDRTQLAGDVNAFAPQSMNVERRGAAFAFAWVEAPAADGSRYKFTDGSSFDADPNARTYAFDGFGEISFVSHDGVDRDAYPRVYERFFDVARAGLLPRNVRVLLPVLPATRVLYAHDGQNLFARDSSIPAGFAIPFGGWQLDGDEPGLGVLDDVLVVAIDNTAERFEDYTHVVDDIGQVVGGQGDLYADFVQHDVRGLVRRWYGEPPIVGVMGSSLGGLISLVIADRYPAEFDFAASLSGTLGWGSIGNTTSDDGDDTILDRYRSHGVRHPVLYIDSGGQGGACADSDGDGVEDDIDRGDNFCETRQFVDALRGMGYVDDTTLRYVFVPGAQHNEAEWHARLPAILAMFASL